MSDQQWLLVFGVALVAAMWGGAEMSDRYREWARERKARREKAAQVERWLVTRLQMREDRHREEKQADEWWHRY